jgi:hypothetical protein
MNPTAISVTIVIALIGWFATVVMISRSAMSGQRKRWLLIPSWIPWVALALGAPILSGVIPLSEAVNIGGGMTMGMVVSLVVSRRQGPRR